MKRLLVMLPAFNEARTIGEVISRIPRAIEGVDSVEIMVIDDGSSDETVDIARAAGADVVSHPENRGVGAAIKTGLHEAARRGVDFAVNIDSDGQFAPEDIPTILKPLIENKADFSTASRFKDPALIPEMPRVKLLGNRGMSRLVSALVGQRFFDVSCGFRAYTRETLLRLILHGKFTYTQETILVLNFHGLRIAEIPIKVRGVREHGKSRVASNLLNYAYRTSSILFSCFRDYRPSMFFNSSALALFLLSFAIGGFFIGHWLVKGQFSPHLWAGFTAAYFFALGIILFFFGQIALMLRRLRYIQEEQLYMLRKRYLNNDDKNDPA